MKTYENPPLFRLWVFISGDGTEIERKILQIFFKKWNEVGCNLDKKTDWIPFFIFFHSITYHSQPLSLVDLQNGARLGKFKKGDSENDGSKNRQRDGKQGR